MFILGLKVLSPSTAAANAAPVTNVVSNEIQTRDLRVASEFSLHYTTTSLIKLLILCDTYMQQGKGGFILLGLINCLKKRLSTVYFVFFFKF